jgi:hypothetical protein
METEAKPVIITNAKRQPNIASTASSFQRGRRSVHRGKGPFLRKPRGFDKQVLPVLPSDPVSSFESTVNYLGTDAAGWPHHSLSDERRCTDRAGRLPAIEREGVNRKAPIIKSLLRQTPSFGIRLDRRSTMLDIMAECERFLTSPHHLGS